MRYFYQIWEDTLPPIMFGNSVLCRPKDNVTPTISQFKRCGSNFWPTILTDRNLIADNCVIIASGAIAYKMLYAIADGTPAPSNILSAHGMPTQLSFRNPNSLEDVRTFTLLPMIHPAYVLRGQSPERFKMIQDDFVNAYNAWCDVQESGKVNMAAFLQQPSSNVIDLDTDLSGDLYTEPLTDSEVDIIMSIIESDYKDVDDKKIVSYDVETTALETQLPTTVITLAGIGTIKRHTFQFEGDAIPSIGKIFTRLKEKGYYLVGHNIWYDLVMSWKAGIFSCVDELPDIRDTRVMHKLIDENSTDNKLKWLCQKYFGIPDWSQELNSMTDSEGKVQWAKLTDENKITLRKYHKGDLYWTVRLCYLFMEMIAKPEVSQYWQIDYVDFKSTLQKELLQTSLNGFMINRQTLEAQKTDYQTRQEAILDWFKQPLYYRVIASLRLLDKPLKEAVQKTLCNFAIGDTYDEKKDKFNPNSTQHVAALLATVLSSDDLMRQKVIKSLGRKGKTAKGKISLNESNLEKICESLANATSLLGGHNPHKYAHLVEGIRKVLEFRGLKKILSTYLEGMEKYMWPDGSVRSQWNVDGAATGRLSCIAKGTLISCIGEDKPIESIHAGDIIYCYDESNRIVERPVVELIDQGMQECVQCTWELGYPHDTWYKSGTLICTPDHKIREVGLLSPFYSWITPTKSWKDRLSYVYGIAGDLYKITNVEPCGIHHVYDLTVEEHHNFIANKICVHNCARPNLQQIPRGDTAKGIKSMFVPRSEGYILMQFDLSQAELRGLGSFTHDPNLKHAYDNGLDLHTYTASNLWHIPMEEVTKHQRSVAKQVNFSIIYGANAPTISANAGIPLPEAEDVLKRWFEFYSTVPPYMEQRSQEVETQGFVTGLWGLKRNLPMSMAYESDGADLKRQAGNAGIQGFASDFNCFLMMIVMGYVKEYNLRSKIRMVNTVHDSIVFEVKEGYESTLASFYTSAMKQMNEYCASLIGEEYYINMRGDLEIGLTYGDMHEAKVDPETFEVSLEEEV